MIIVKISVIFIKLLLFLLYIKPCIIQFFYIFLNTQILLEGNHQIQFMGINMRTIQKEDRHLFFTTAKIIQRNMIKSHF